MSEIQEKILAFTEWDDPIPFTAASHGKPYPIDALPREIKDAVKEVRAFVQAPMALVASSALSTLSIVGQGFVDVKRAEKLQSPTSLFFLSVLDSGERKSATDGYFKQPILEYEREHRLEAEPLIRKYKAEYAAWQAERDGIVAAIKNMAKSGKSAQKQKQDLEELELHEPKEPRVPKILLGDETPESLGYALAKRFPLAAIATSEGGSVLGGHAMNADSVMRNLAQYNSLWDGAKISVGRRSSESYEIEGARFSISIAVQRPTIQAFIRKTGGLARGTGFFARCLMAWPESTQGTRFFQEAPKDWPSLEAYHERIRALLAQPLPMVDGRLEPFLMELSPDAKAAWVRFHDDIEAELSNSGELYAVRDIASKTADNAARLAALFELFTNGLAREVGRESFVGAAAIVGWHLYETRRFFDDLDIVESNVDAQKLEAFLIREYVKTGEPFYRKNKALQYSPIRNSENLNKAIDELVSLNRLRQYEDETGHFLETSPLVREVQR